MRRFPARLKPGAFEVLAEAFTGPAIARKISIESIPIDIVLEMKILIYLQGMGELPSYKTESRIPVLDSSNGIERLCLSMIKF